MEKAKKTMDSMIENQSKIINNWVDTTKKMQRAAADGNAMEKSANLYNEWLGNQMSIFKNITLNKENETTSQESSQHNADDFFKSWYNSQVTLVKQMTDFNQKMYAQMLNFGKPQEEVSAQFENMNKAWTNMYNNWTNTLHSTYENLSSSMKSGMNKDMFSSLYNNNQVFLKMYEAFQPMMKAFNSNGFNADQLKDMMSAEFYKSMTEKMFESFFPKNDFASMFEMYQNNMKNMMGNSSNISKEMMENYSAMMKNMPEMFANSDMSKMMKTSTELMDLYQKPFSQMMKMMNPGKEKHMMEAMVATMDKVNEYQLKQSQLQYLLYTTAKKSMETSIQNNMNKVSENTEVGNFNIFFNEWVSTTEKAFTELFAKDEFSQLKAEVTTLSMSIKKDFDTQMTTSLENTPFAFKSDMDEVYKNIYDLKKMVKHLQKMLDINEEVEKVKTTRSKKK
jgi:heme oxygenase